MKRWLAICVLLALAVTVTATVSCRRSSGGDEAPPVTGNEPVIPSPGPGPAPGTPDVVFSSPVQAAQATSVVAGMQTLASTQFAVASALGVDAQPGGFAPSLSKSSDIGNIDPALAAIVGKMKSFAGSATIRSAVRKAGALRAKAMRATVPETTLTMEACNAEGQAVISGENTYDDAGNPNIVSKYTVTFTNCKDSGDLTQVDGVLHIEQFMSTENDGVASTVVATGLTIMQFTATPVADFAVMTQKSVMDGTFISDDQVVRGANFADGSFVVTTPAQGIIPEKVELFEFDGLEEDRTLTHNPDLTNTTVTTTKGTFKATATSGGAVISQVTVALDLAENTVILNDLAGTRNNKLNGTIDVTFGAGQTLAGCLSGKLNISTVDTAPRVFTTAGGACPTNGTVQINSATINYEPGSPIQVAVGSGTPVNYADCAALDAASGSCKF
jgi:hypothetical protein